jgi:rare lipoprotein A
MRVRRLLAMALLLAGCAAASAQEEGPQPPSGMQPRVVLPDVQPQPQPQPQSQSQSHPQSQSQWPSGSPPDAPAFETQPSGPPAAETRHGEDHIEVDRGIASWYGKRFHGRRTASGERFDMHEFTAAHRTLPFGTLVRVEHEPTGRSVLVRINDRGPHIRRRVIDLSRAAAQALGLLDSPAAVVVRRVLAHPGP